MKINIRFVRSKVLIRHLWRNEAKTNINKLRKSKQVIVPIYHRHI